MILDRLLDLEKTPLARRYSDREYDLDGYRRWLAELGAPQNGQRFVHLAGTKGKGSTGAMIESLLRGLGFPTAFYSSPHLKHFGDRYRFDGAAWTFEEFEASLERLVASLPPAQRHGFDAPHPYRTAFEFLTLLALVEFGARDRRLQQTQPTRPRQIVVWETGLGGRLDCTNVVDPLVTVITPLGLDHTAVLGATIEQIAAEKAGIFKPGRPAIIARQPAEFHERVWPVLERRAAEVAAPVIRAWEFCSVLEAKPLFGGQLVRVRLPDGRADEVFLPLVGAFQRTNLEAAIAASWLVVEQCQGCVTGSGFLQGLETVRWPGRLEIHLTTAGQALIIDGAHCPLSARTVVQALRDWQDSIPLPCRPPYEVLWGMQRDKDHAAFLRGLRAGAPPDFFGQIHACPVSGPRGADPQALAEVARAEGWQSHAHPSLEAALATALATRHSVLAVGTLYTIAALRELWTSRKPAPAHQALP